MTNRIVDIPLSHYVLRLVYFTLLARLHTGQPHLRAQQSHVAGGRQTRQHSPDFPPGIQSFPAQWVPQALGELTGPGWAWKGLTLRGLPAGGKIYTWSLKSPDPSPPPPAPPRASGTFLAPTATPPAQPWLLPRIPSRAPLPEVRFHRSGGGARHLYF